MVQCAHLEKYEFVNGKDDNPYMKWNIKNVWNHQPVFWGSKDQPVWYTINFPLITYWLFSRDVSLLPSAKPWEKNVWVCLRNCHLRASRPAFSNKPEYPMVGFVHSKIPIVSIIRPYIFILYSWLNQLYLIISMSQYIPIISCSISIIFNYMFIVLG